jgi:hypothetical protein
MIYEFLKNENANNTYCGGDIVDDNKKNNDFRNAKSSYEDVRDSQDNDLKNDQND